MLPHKDMKQLRLLMADNSPSALEVYAEIFERAGYKVTRAGSYDQAQSALENMYFHVAVLDLRLRRNNDRMDISGMELARKSSPAIAKVILTAFGSTEHSRDALAPDSRGARAAVSFVRKDESISLLLEHVDRAVKSLGIRRDLVINWVAVDRASLIQSLLPQEAEPGHVEDGIEEVEDLIGRLFPKARSVNLERILWQKTARAALLVTAVFAGGITKFSILVLGLRDAVSNEAAQFQALGLDISWPGVPLLERTQSSVRFAGNLLVFSGLNLQESRPLADLFRSSLEKTFASALHHLFIQILPRWHRTPLPDPQKIKASWTIRSGVLADDIFSKAVLAVRGHIHGLGAEMEVREGKLHAWLKGIEYIFPDPGSWLSGQIEDRSIPMYLLPGLLDGGNILADGHGGIGLTNFTEAGGGPLLAPFLEIEAAVRFDWNDEQDLARLLEIDKVLTEGGFSTLIQSETDIGRRKLLRAVLAVRRYAEPLLNERWTEWSTGLLFEIARRVAINLNAPSQLDPELLHRQAHLILAAGLIVQRMGLHRAVYKSRRALEIDASNQAVMIYGVHVPLTSQNFRLLNCLYESEGSVCSSEVLVRRGLEENYYDAKDEHQRGRLNVAIHRLREKIEGPDTPTFIRKEAGGYRLYRDFDKMQIM
jgi:DNA-binding response OmpR family regulator